MSLRIARTLALGTVLAIATLALVTPASASPSQPVTLTVLSTIDPEAVDPFTSTGDVVCAEGEVGTLFQGFAGGQSGTHARINAVKLFICPTGTFEVHLRVTLDFETNGTNGTWSVSQGTGAFDKLHGTGGISGTRVGDKVLDVYTGSMHID